jgi:hypothetical protein
MVPVSTPLVLLDTLTEFDCLLNLQVFIRIVQQIFTLHRFMDGPHVLLPLVVICKVSEEVKIVFLIHTSTSIVLLFRYRREVHHVICFGFKNSVVHQITLLFLHGLNRGTILSPQFIHSLLLFLHQSFVLLTQPLKINLISFCAHHFAQGIA